MLVHVAIRVGIELPKIEVRYEHLAIEGEAYVGTRALPTLINSTLNAVEVPKYPQNDILQLCFLFFFFLWVFGFYFLHFKAFDVLNHSFE